MSLSIIDIVRWQHRYPEAPQSFQWCTHRSHVIAVHLQVAGECMIGGERIILNGPFLGLSAAGERDGNRISGENRAWWCFFDGPLVTSVPGGRQVEVHLDGQSMRRGHHHDLTPAEAADVGERFAQAAAAWRRADLSSRLVATALITGILATWCAPLAESTADQGLATRYRRLIEEGAVDPKVSLDAIARRIGRSTDRLATLFRATFGLTPVAYRQRVRLAAAAEMLAVSDLAVAEVARRSGFAGAAHLSHAFQRAYGRSPRAWSQFHAGVRGTEPPDLG